LSGRGLCDELITRPEESYRLCCVVVCDLEASRIGAPYIYDISNLRVKVQYTGHVLNEVTIRTSIGPGRNNGKHRKRLKLGVYIRGGGPLHWLQICQ